VYFTSPASKGYRAAGSKITAGTRGTLYQTVPVQNKAQTVCVVKMNWLIYVVSASFICLSTELMFCNITA